MKNLFVPYALALKAKEAGFDEPCATVIWEDGFISSVDVGIAPLSAFSTLTNSNLDKVNKSPEKLIQCCVAASLYQQLIDWFREKHNIHISITPIADLVHQNDEFSHNGFFSALLEDVTVGKVFHASNTIALVSDKYNYKQALIAGLEKAFELIKK